MPLLRDRSASKKVARAPLGMREIVWAGVPIRIRALRVTGETVSMAAARLRHHHSMSLSFSNSVPRSVTAGYVWGSSHEGRPFTSKMAGVCGNAVVAGIPLQGSRKSRRSGGVGRAAK